MNRLSWQTENYNYNSDYSGWLCKLTPLDRHTHPWYVVFKKDAETNLYGG